VRKRRIVGYTLLQFERLEGRALLAGTVKVFSTISPSTPPALLIVGDGASNAIVIHETASSDGTVQVKIRGIDTRIVSITQINGFEIASSREVKSGTAFTFTAHDIDVALGVGDDFIKIHDTTIPGHLSIAMGTGDDTVRLDSVQVLGAISGPVSNLAPLGTEGSSVIISSQGRGNTVSLKKVTAAGNVTVDTDRGRNDISLDQVVAGSVGSGNQLAANLGLLPRRQSHIFGHVSVSASAADSAIFNNYDGKRASLSLASNQFGSESDSGFAAVLHVSLIGLPLY
jgi:hypothetical protein